MTTTTGLIFSFIPSTWAYHTHARTQAKDQTIEQSANVTTHPVATHGREHERRVARPAHAHAEARAVLQQQRQQFPVVGFD